MRWSFQRFFIPLFLLAASVCFITSPSHAQELKASTSRFEVKDMSLIEVLESISVRFEVTVLYSRSFLEGYRVDSFSTNIMEPAIILSQLLEGYGFSINQKSDIYVLVPDAVLSRDFVVSGYVKDEKSGEPLVNAYIVELYSQQGTYTNEYGFYSLRMRGGQRSLTYGYLGYDEESRSFFVGRDNEVDVLLLPDARLTEVTIMAYTDNIDLQQSLNSSNIPQAGTPSPPTLDGSRDVIRSTHHLAGVQTNGDGIGGISVRGGGIEHNLFLLDGVRVYNPTHLNGLVSITNDSWVNTARFHKSSGTARYFGSLASVMDIRTKDGNSRSFEGEFESDLVSSAVTLQGPWSKDRSSFLVSGRYSYIGDLINIGDNVFNDPQELVNFGYSFHDVFVKNNISISDKSHIYLSLYHGGDRFENTNEELFLSSNGGIRSKLTNRFEWGNTVVSARFNSQLSNRVFFRATAYYSAYDQDFSESILTEEFEGVENDPFSVVEQGTFGRSELVDIGLSIDVDYNVNSGFDMKMGMDIIEHQFSPVALLRESIGSPLDPEGSLEELERGESYNFTELTGFWENKFQMDHLNLNAGINVSMLPLGSSFTTQLNPRLQLNWRWAEWLSMYAFAGRSSQPFHLLQTSSFGLPSDAWVPLTDQIDPQLAYNYALAWKAAPRKDIRINFGGFYNDFSNLVEYKEGALTGIDGLSSLQEWQEAVVGGDGRAYGLELEMMMKGKTWTTSMSATWSRSERSFEDLNLGRKFWDDQDRPWKVNLSFSQQVWADWMIGANIQWMAGNPITFPVGEQIIVDPQTNTNIRIPIIESRNGLRLPNYFRADLSLSYVAETKLGRRSLDLGIYNITNHTNILFYRFVATQEEEVKFLRATLIPIVPMIRFSQKF